jgi:hypothetical protein
MRNVFSGKKDLELAAECMDARAINVPLGGFVASSN